MKNGHEEHRLEQYFRFIKNSFEIFVGYTVFFIKVTNYKYDNNRI